MVFNFPFGKKKKIQKLIGNFVSSRVKEKRAFANLIEQLDAELYNNQIEQKAYERLRWNIEVQFYQKQQKEWAEIKPKFHKLNS
jgi:hypothetical protein